MKMKLPYHELNPRDNHTFDMYIFKQSVPFDLMGFRIKDPNEVERVGREWIWVVTQYERSITECDFDQPSDICLTQATITKYRDLALRQIPCIVEVQPAYGNHDDKDLIRGFKHQYKVRFWNGEVLVVCEPSQPSPDHWYHTIHEMYKSNCLDLVRLYQLLKPSKSTEASNMCIDLLSMCQSKEERIAVEAGILLRKAEEQIRQQIIVNNTYDKYQHMTTPMIQGLTVQQLYDALEKGLDDGTFKSQLTVKYDPPRGPSLGDRTEYVARITFNLQVR